MAESYFEKPISEANPEIDDPIIYKVTEEHFTLTVYSEVGRVSKYWNVRVLKDTLGYVRVACPREKKILHFNFFEWSAFFFTQSGMKELVMMPDSRKRTITKLTKS